nr:hypothetical protein GCM10025732_06750 [Glycomyces mayteni]
MCADITVTPVAGNAVADTGADVWIPETGLWRNLPEAGLAEQWEVLQESTASSAVGLALPEGAATDQVLPDETEVALQDPRRHAASLMWIIIFGVDEYTAEGGDGAAVMSAPEVAAHNAAEADQLQAPTGATQVAQFEYPMYIAAGTGEDEREAAQNLLRSYSSQQYSDLLAQHGLTLGIPQPSPTSTDIITAALAAWDER